MREVGLEGSVGGPEVEADVIVEDVLAVVVGAVDVLGIEAVTVVFVSILEIELYSASL